MSVTTAQAISLLENVLFESATAAKANAAAWVSLSNLNSSYSTVAGLAGAMAQTAEASIAQQVIRYYEGALGRAPSGAEVTYYVNIVENGNAAAGIPAMTSSQILTGASAVPAGTWDKIAAFFAASPEFAFASAGGNVVNLLYLNILGRAPSAAEVAYYQNLLSAGTSVSTLVQYFTTSPEYQGAVNSGIQSGLASYGSTVAGGGTAPTTVVTYAPGGGNGGGAVGTTYTLTTSVDTFTGTANNDTFNGVLSGTGGATSTVTGLDSIDGGAGTDTLNIVDTTTGTGNAITLPGTFTVKNVEIVNITTNGGFGTGTGAGTAFDLSGWAGLQTANLVSSDSAATAINATVADTTALNLTVAGTGTISTHGGSTVNLIDNTAGGAVTITGGAALTSVTVTGGGGTSVNISDNANGTLTSVTLKSLTTNATITSTSDTAVTLSGANVAGHVVTLVNGTAGHADTVTISGAGYDASGAAQQMTFKDVAAKTITVNATAKSDLLLSTGAADTTLTKVIVTGSGDLVLGLDATNNTAIATVDASAATGKLTLGTLNAATTTVTTGSGNDSFTLAATTAATVNTGAGNDTVTLGAALAAGSSINLGDGNDVLLGTTAPAASTQTATTVIDGGAGTNSVSTALINAGNAAEFKNFQNLSLQNGSTLDVSLVTGSTITGLTVDAASGNVTLSNATASMSLTDNWVGDNSANAITLGMTGVGGSSDAYTITFNGAAQTSQVSSANVLLGTVKAAGIETFNIASGGTNDWNSVKFDADTSATTIVVTGGTNLDLAFGAAGTFGDATNHNGVSLIDGSAATGKLAIDLTNLAAGAVNGLVVKGGTGADTITTAAYATTLTGGTGADNFKVGATLTASATAPVFTTITDGSTGDIITVAAATTDAGFTTAKVSVGSATDLVSAINNVITASAGSATTSVEKWFQYGGNTYLVEHIGTGTALGTGDLVVKLTGLIDLSTATYSTTNHTLTLG